MTEIREIRTDLVMQVVQRDGSVIMLFSKNIDGQLVAEKTDCMLLPPAAAIGAAEALTAMAFEADTKLKPVGDTLKASLVQRHRDKLIPRMAVMLNSMRELKTMSNGQLALALMDAVCHEVFP